MAMKIGTENKRQVYLAIGLGIAIVVIVIVQLSSTTKTNTTASVARTEAKAPPARSHSNLAPLDSKSSAPVGNQTTQSAPAAEKVASLNIDPALHLLRLSYTESIYYEGRGRNIFSMDSVPMAQIEELAGPVRPNTVTEVKKNPLDYEARDLPPIDLKYFGYTVGKDKSYKAFFVRGDDIFVARTGEIVDHVYKVGTITATGVEVTDLGHNNTRTVPLIGANAGRN